MEGAPTLLSMMTPFPYAAPAELTLAEAAMQLEEHGVRHLPLVRGERIVGLLRRDVVDAALAHGAEGRPALSVARPDPMVVDQGARLEDVLVRLADDVGDAVLVLRHGKLVGIVTSADICRGFAALLGQGDEGDPDVA